MASPVRNIATSRLDCGHEVAFSPPADTGCRVFCMRCAQAATVVIPEVASKTFILSCGHPLSVPRDKYDRYRKYYCPKCRKKNREVLRETVEWRVSCSECHYGRYCGEGGEDTARLAAKSHHGRSHHRVSYYRDGFPASRLWFERQPDTLSLDGVKF